MVPATAVWRIVRTRPLRLMRAQYMPSRVGWDDRRVTRMTSTWPRWAQLPGWLLLAPRLERLTQFTFGLATLIGLVLLVSTGASWLNYFALTLTAGGAVLSNWWRWPGVIVASFGPLVSVVAPSTTTPNGVGSETVLIWSLVVFAAFYWALEGAKTFALGVGLGLMSALAFAVSSTAPWLDPLVLAALATTIASAAVGSAVSSQRRYRSEAERRLKEARLAREAEIDRRIAQERVRIARDLHDMVGHQVAVVNMHLGAAEVHLATDADATRSDLEAARGGVQGVLRETQRILEILRGTPTADDLAPSADHRSVPALLDSFAAAGMPLDTHLDQLPDDISPDVSAALYRTAQEAVTNAHKHGTGTIFVRLNRAGTLVDLTVSNPTGRPSATPGGLGLVGMRERVTSAGGMLDVSPSSERFTIRATMRLDGKRVQ